MTARWGLPPSRPRRLWAVAVCAAALAGCLAGDRQEPVENLVLVTIDTLRVDHVGVYGHEAPTTPNIDRLAARSIVYGQAYAPTPWTPPSHASLLTGKLPPAHGVRRLWTDRLADENLTIAEILHAADFETAGFVSAVPLRRKAGFAQGFARWSGVESDGNVMAERSGAGTTRQALRWLERHHGRRFFVWVHYFEPHAPYRHFPAYDAAVRAAGRSVPDRRYVKIMPTYLYDSEIHRVDREVGRLLDGLAAFGVADRTAVVVTSDHGEHFGEHDLYAHAGVYEPVLRVPLLVHDPRRPPREERIATVARLTDVFATMLHLVGEAAPPGLPEARVLPPFADDRAPRHVYSEHRRRTVLAYGLREGPWKLVTWGWPDSGAPGRVELYDVVEDPGELENRAAAEPARVQAMLARLALQRRTPAAAPRERASPRPGVAERLRSLGYTE